MWENNLFLLLWLSHLFSALTFIPAALLISVLSNIHHLHFVQSYNRLTSGYISCTSFTVGYPPDLRVQHRANIWRPYRYWELRLLEGGKMDGNYYGSSAPWGLCHKAYLTIRLDIYGWQDRKTWYRLLIFWTHYTFFATIQGKNVILKQRFVKRRTKTHTTTHTKLFSLLNKHDNIFSLHTINCTPG